MNLVYERQIGVFEVMIIINKTAEIFMKCFQGVKNQVAAEHHQRAQKTSEGIEIADPEESTAAENSISPYASPEVQEFIRGQVINGLGNKKGRRYGGQGRRFALALRYHNPKACRF